MNSTTGITVNPRERFRQGRKMSSGKPEEPIPLPTRTHTTTQPNRGSRLGYGSVVSDCCYDFVNRTANPEYYCDPNGNMIQWIYTAGGTKLRKNVFLDYELSSCRDYLNGIEYQNDTLSFMPTATGRAVRPD